MSKAPSNNLWFGRPRLFGLLLAAGVSIAVWSLVYFAVTGWRAGPEQPDASRQPRVEVRPQEADEAAQRPTPDPVRPA